MRLITINQCHTVKITSDFNVKNCENATVKPVKWFTVSSPNTYSEKRNRHFRQFYGEIPFLEVKKNVKLQGLNLWELDVPRIPALPFKTVSS